MRVFFKSALCYNTFFKLFSGVANNSKATKIKEYGDRFEGDSQSIYSARGWQFDRNSPYSGSPFASIDAIPGFDEDGLPSDPRPADTHV